MASSSQPLIEQLGVGDEGYWGKQLNDYNRKQGLFMSIAEEKLCAPSIASAIKLPVNEKTIGLASVRPGRFKLRADRSLSNRMRGIRKLL